MRVAIYTLGCKLNQVESEALMDAFLGFGHQQVPINQEADLYIINTCTVTSKAEQKARRIIRKSAEKPNKPMVIVTGCYAQVDPEIIEKLNENLLIIPLDRKAEILQMPEFIEKRREEGMSLEDSLHAFLNTGNRKQELSSSPFDYDPNEFSRHSRAFLKIEDGCDNVCAYCRVRIARGRAVSLDADTVIDRALRLEHIGYREIVLTGVNITAYFDAAESHRHFSSRDGNERGGINLASLIKKLDEKLNYARIRLSSLEPEDLDDELIEATASSCVLPHFHIPVQSGSDAVLAAVKRKNRTDDVVRAVTGLRAMKNDPFIAADVMTGLPGETEEDFVLTMELLKLCDFTQVHVFPYSPRPGTPLFDTSLKKVPEYLRDERAAEVRRFSQKQHERYIKRHIDREFSAVLESPYADEQVGEMTAAKKLHTCRGLTENYLHVKVFGVPADNPDDVRGRRCIIDVDTYYPESKRIDTSFVQWCDIEVQVSS